MWVAWLVACGGDKDGDDSGGDGAPSTGACAYPAGPSAPGGILTNADDCGFWAIAVDEHLVVDLAVESEDVDCTGTVSSGVRANGSPIYSNFGDTGPKWTFDFVGDAPEDPYATVALACTDGTAWSARVAVGG